MRSETLFDKEMAELTAIMDEEEVSRDEMKAVIVELSEQMGKPAAVVAEFAKSRIAEGMKTEDIYMAFKEAAEPPAEKKTCCSSCAETWKDNVMRRFTRIN